MGGVNTIIPIEPGFYTNLFEVLVPEQEIQIMLCERGKYPRLSILRDKIKKSGKEIFVYAPQRSDKIYGYGNDMLWLSNKDFSSGTINLYHEPRLTTRMIMEGIVNKIRQLGYVPQRGDHNKDVFQILEKNKGRLKVYNYNQFKITSDNQVKIFTGYDLRTIFLRDPVEDKLKFGLVVDVTYSLKDINDNSLNYHQIISRFGNNTLKEVRQIQKDLIPTGINKEVSRQRLIEDIIPLVKQLNKIDLPCGLKVEINSNPCRIILGGEDESVW